MSDQPGPELRIAIARLARRIRSQRVRDDLTDGQTSALFAVSLHGPLSLSELSERERVTPPSMNRTVNWLEDAGLIKRGSSPDDGRKVIIEATPLGTELVQQMRLRRDAWFAQRLAELTPEQRRILADAEPVLRQLAEQ